MAAALVKNCTCGTYLEAVEQPTMNRTESLVHTLLASVTTLTLTILLAGCGASAATEVADVTPIPIYTPWSATATPLPATQEPPPALTTTTEPTATQEPTATANITTTALPPSTETQATLPAPATAPVAAEETPAAEAPADTTPLPADFAFALENANAADGEQLTVSNGCIACHGLVEGQAMVGPSWYGVGTHAATRVAGESAPYYLYQSILEPNAHIVGGFPPDLMPKVYADTLSTEQIAGIVAYLLSLQVE